MNIRRKTVLLLFLYLLILCIEVNFAKTPDKLLNQSQKFPVNKLDEKTFLTKWIVVGPFPSPLADETMPDGSQLVGFYVDFLQPLGGEEKAVLDTATSISFKNDQNELKSIKPFYIKTKKNGYLDFIKYFGQLDYKVAYVFCYIYSDKDQNAGFLLGSDDGVKVWVNGELVHRNDAARGLVAGEDHFRARLHKGYNSVLVKISQWVRGWGLVVEALSEESYTKIEEKERRIKDFDQFLRTTLVPEQENTWNYVFGPGEFPRLKWEKPYLAAKVIGHCDLSIRWFDSNLNEVKKAENPGRYAFYAEGISEKGIHIRRAGTLFCMPWDWMAWAEKPKARLNYIPLKIFNKQAWQQYQDPIAEYAGRMVLLSILNQQEGAVLLSFLDEIQPSPVPIKLTDTPVIFDQDFHLALKRKILNVEGKWQPLQRPQKLSHESGKVLHFGSEAKAGFKPGTADKIRKVCEEWYEYSQEPFIVLIARHGVIVLNQAFGENPAGKINLQTTTEMASLTKLVTGLLFAEFVDQGLIDIDDPVGKFLPDFPIDGEKALTMRHLFTHTSGLWGHEEWGGLHSPWLDNKIANILPELEVGKKHNYNGMGYDLAGKVMEMVSGKSIFRLFRENLFDPLGMKNTTLQEDLGFSCFSNAGEFAILGQLLLNRGSYGNLRFFSPETFEKLLPQSLHKFYPEVVDVEWGIGITWMREEHPEAGKNNVPAGKLILSKNVIGHGSATSAVLRVDLDNDLVICQTRRRGGKGYDKFLKKFLLTIENGLTE